MEEKTLTCPSGDALVERQLEFVVFHHAGEAFAGFPVLGGDGQGAGGRVGAVKLFLEIQKIGAEDTRFLLDPEKLETGIARQVGGQTTDFGVTGDVEVGHVGWEDVEDDVADVGGLQACGWEWGR